MAKDLSSARRGRRHVSRDYTSKLRSDINVRETERRAKMATAGMIGDFASGVADYAETLKTNMEGWKTLEAGGKELHKKGIEAGTIKEGTEFDLATSLGGDYAKEGISKWDMWTTQAPVTKQMNIGKDKFYGINVAQVGKLGESAGLLVDKKSNKSLYDFLKIGGDKSTASDPVSSIGELETMKKARPKQSSSSQLTSPSITKITGQGHFGGAADVDLNTYGSVKHQTGSQNVTTNQTTAPTFVNPTPYSSSDNLYDNYGVTNWFDSQEGGSDSSSLYDDIYGGGNFGVVPLGSVDVSRGMGGYRLKE